MTSELPIDVLEEDLLIDRLLNAQREGQKVVFLVGSPLTMPESSGAPGVPGVAAILELIRQSLGESASRLDALDLQNPTKAYQVAFKILQAIRGQNVVNRVIRQAVLMARQPNGQEEVITQIVQAPSPELCEFIQHDNRGWYLREGMEALGKILSYYNDTFGRLILTTNFDPLIEVAVERAYGSVYSTALHSDGSFGASYGTGCHVVHLHGFWYGSDTLHTPQHLLQDRPHPDEPSDFEIGEQDRLGCFLVECKRQPTFCQEKPDATVLSLL